MALEARAIGLKEIVDARERAARSEEEHPLRRESGLGNQIAARGNIRGLRRKTSRKKTKKKIIGDECFNFVFFFVV